MPFLLSAGSNAQGQLGNGSTDDSHSFQRCSFLGCDPGALPPGTTHVISISGGANHTLALLDIRDGASRQLSRQLWGCGSGSHGQLGPAFIPPTLPAGSSPVFRPVVLSLEQHDLASYSYKKVCASWQTTYVVLESDGKGDLLISMGANDFGDLGVGSRRSKEKEKPFHVVNFDHILVDGLSLSPDTIVVLDIAAGQHHVVVYLRAIIADDTSRSFLVGWGASRHGQLGELLSSTPKEQPFVSKPRLINMSDDVIGLALGMRHTILLHATMRVSGIGSNRKGQLSEVQLWNHVRRVACTWNGTYAVVDDDTGKWQIISIGSNSHGQLGRTLSNDASSRGAGPVAFRNNGSSFGLKGIACGSEHVLCLLSAPSVPAKRGYTEVWGWGWNEHGNLGLGTMEDMQAPIKLWPTEPNDIHDVDGIWAGCGTSWLYMRTS